VPLSAQPYRPARKAPFLAFMLIGVMIMFATIVSVGQRGFSWLWVVPFLVTAASVYAYRRERVAQNMAQGGLWALVQIICAFGALALIVLPAKY
jgi:hypothetical protein